MALVGGPFSLTDQDGRRVSEKDFLGKHMLVFFGYTYCPDICPTELQVMTAALDTLGPEAEKIQPVFVSVDPERDTPEVLKSYVENFGPRLIGLTGTPEEIAAIAKAYRVYYAKAGQPGLARRLSDGSFQHHLPDGARRAFREAFHLHHRRGEAGGGTKGSRNGFPLKSDEMTGCPDSGGVATVRVLTGASGCALLSLRNEPCGAGTVARRGRCGHQLLEEPGQPLVIDPARPFLGRIARTLRAHHADATASRNSASSDTIFNDDLVAVEEVVTPQQALLQAPQLPQDVGGQEEAAQASDRGADVGPLCHAAARHGGGDAAAL